eukprot:1682653-Rhodomonas_salina.1
MTSLDVENPEPPAEGPPESANEGYLTEEEFANLTRGQTGNESQTPVIRGNRNQQPGVLSQSSAPIAFGRPAIGFSRSSIETDNNNPNFILPLRLSKPDDETAEFLGSFSSVGVQYRVEGKTARPGRDFDTGNGVVNFEPLSTVGTLAIPIKKGSFWQRYPIELVVILTGVSGDAEVHETRQMINVTIHNPGQSVRRAININRREAITLTNGAGIVIPPGSLGADKNNTEILCERDVDPPPLPSNSSGPIRSVSDVLSFGPSGLTFDNPVYIYIEVYQPTMWKVAIFYYNETSLEWEEVPDSSYNMTTGFAMVGILHFSSYSAFSSPCQNGTYLSNVTCVDCPAFSTSPNEAVSISNCTCLEGYTGNYSAGCTPCNNGTFLAADGGSEAQCICAAGFYGNDGTCTLCPANTYSPAGSAQLSDCTCNIGFQGSDGAACSACERGKFKAVNGSGQCSTCAASTYQNTTEASACMG